MLLHHFHLLILFTESDTQPMADGSGPAALSAQSPRARECVHSVHRLFVHVQTTHKVSIFFFLFPFFLISVSMCVCVRPSVSFRQTTE